MNLDELIKQFRNYMDDKVAPYLWDDDEVILYINEAEREAARRSRCLTDSLDPEICYLPVKAGQSVYKLDKRILYVRRMKTDKHDRLLTPVRAHLLECHDNKWESRTGRVENVVMDHNSRSVTLYRVPSEDQTIRMTVVRLPVRKMASLSDEPEIPEEYHLAMLNYAYYLAYSKQDVEGNSEDRAQMFYNRFEAEFGPKYLSSALQEEFENENAYIFNDGRF